MSQDPIKVWLKQFIADAASDSVVLLDDHMNRLSEVVSVPQTIRPLVDGTVQVVVACCAYWSIGNGDPGRIGRFLDFQKYSLWDRQSSGYVLTFDLHAEAYGSIRVEDVSMLRAYVDLADLYCHPWWEYETVGYGNLHITRSDWDELSETELEQINSQVTEDIRWDYAEDELGMWTELSDERNCLTVHLQEHYGDVV